jgi:hypothetical protein
MEAIDLREKTINLDRFQFSPTQVIPSSADMTMEDWERLGEFIRLTNQASQWWWGDWLNMGEDAFGEESSQALETTRWDEETLRIYSWVCRKVPAVNRLTGVPFSHYVDIAKLPVDQQRAWAEQVASEQWSRRQLQRALRGDGAVDTQPCVLIRCKSEADADAVEGLLPESVRSTCDVERVTRKRIAAKAKKAEKLFKTAKEICEAAERDVSTL